jgi:hypothetical protein
VGKFFDELIELIWKRTQPGFKQLRKQGARPSAIWTM